ncbi:MAG: hypothetical protein WCW35_15400 [Bacteroidota bacterium]|jgi:hypothetical protein
MRKSLLLAILFTTMVQSQVLNDARVLLAGKMDIGLSAVRINNSNGQSARIGIGLIRGADAEIVGTFEQDRYTIGVNTEIALGYRPDISLTIGGHYQQTVKGLDATITISFPVNRFFSMYTGIDGDMILGSGSSQTPVWYFAGINSFLYRGFELFLEVDPGVAGPAASLFAAGLRLYF